MQWRIVALSGFSIRGVIFSYRFTDTSGCPLSAPGFLCDLIASETAVHTPTRFASTFRSDRFCWMCGEPVSLETCKIDERGNPVHEDCYTARIKANAESARQTTNPNFTSET
jgi:hypothetical protein